MAATTAAPAFSMSTTPGRPISSIVYRSACRISAAVRTGSTSSTLAQVPSAGQKHGEHEQAEGQPIVDERLVVAHPHVAQEEFDGEEAEDGGRSHAEEDGGRVGRLAEEGRYLHERCPRRDRQGEEEAEARGLLALVAQEESHADRGPGARHAGDDGERLGEADEHPVATGHG